MPDNAGLMFNLNDMFKEFMSVHDNVVSLLETSVKPEAKMEDSFFYDVRIDNETAYVQAPIKISNDGFTFWKKAHVILSVVCYLWGEPQTYDQTKLWSAFTIDEGKH